MSIFLTQADGTLLSTEHHKGRLEERQYFRVMIAGEKVFFKRKGTTTDARRLGTIDPNTEKAYLRFFVQRSKSKLVTAQCDDDIHSDCDSVVFGEHNDNTSVISYSDSSTDSDDPENAHTPYAAEMDWQQNRQWGDEDDDDDDVW